MKQTAKLFMPEYVEHLNEETLAAIDDVNNNRNMSKAYDDMDELMKDLNS